MRRTTISLLPAALLLAACGDQRSGHTVQQESTTVSTVAPEPKPSPSADTALQRGASHGSGAIQRIELRGKGWQKQVVAVFADREELITSTARTAALIDGGRSVVFDSTDGAGGFEAEGKSLYRYDAATGGRTKLMAEYFVVDSIRTVQTAAGNTALLVRMLDGGLGANHLAVVDPDRGEVFRAVQCRVGAISGDSLRVDYFTEWAWGVLNEGKPASVAKVKPFRSKMFSLTELLRRPVIRNKNSYAE